MARLIDIPNELLQEIIANIHPSAIIDFACTCKHFYALAPKYLKRHRERLQKYYEVTDKHSLTIPTVLHEVLEDPSLAWYIRRLVFFYHREHWGDWHEYHDRDQGSEGIDTDSDFSDGPFYDSSNLPATFQESVRQALQKPPFNPDFDSSVRSIEMGGDLFPKLLLVCKASNLQTLVITAHQAPNDNIIERVSEAILANSMRPPAEQFDCFRSVSCIYLNHRTIVQEEFGYQVFLSTINWAPFMTLPALTEFEVFWDDVGGGEEWYEWGKQFAPRSSPLQHLRLGSDSPVTESEISGILGGIRTLKSFTIDCEYHEVTPEMRNQTGSVVDSLLHNHADTLEVMRLASLECVNPIISLRGFKVLREVRVAAQHLYKGQDEFDRPVIVELSQCMPVTLETLKIFDSFSGSRMSQKHGVLKDRLIDFMAAKDRYYPLLRGICTRALQPNFEEIDAIRDVDSAASIQSPTSNAVGMRSLQPNFEDFEAVRDVESGPSIPSPTPDALDAQSLQTRYVTYEELANLARGVSIPRPTQDALRAAGVFTGVEWSDSKEGVCTVCRPARRVIGDGSDRIERPCG